MADTQIIICGFPRSGSTLLYAMMRASAEGIGFPEREESAKATLRQPGSYVTKRPKDVFDLDALLAASKRRKDVRIVLTVRDPRAVLLSIRSSWPHQPFIGPDHCLHISAEWASLSDPGLHAFGEAVTAARRRTDVPVWTVRYEDLVRDPEAVRHRLAEFTGLAFSRPFSRFYEEEVPEALLGPLNGLRPADPTRLRPWNEPAAARRVVRAFRRDPRLFELLEDLGYETDRGWFNTLMARAPEALDDSPGTVVGYHTADAIYAGEARRLRASLDRLGLPVDLTEIAAGSSWLGAVRLKPAFLRERRQALRGWLLYLDVDAVVHADPWPILNGFTADAAFCVHRDGRARIGTLLLADTPGALRFLDDWAERLAAAPRAWDQHPLDDIVRDARQGRTLPYAVQLLPPSMCYIFDQFRKRPHEAPPERFVEHLQASREMLVSDPLVDEALRRRRERIAAIEQGLSGAGS